MKSTSSFNDFVERQQKENQKNWSLNQKGQKIQLIGLEQDIQDLHKEEQEIQTKCELNKRLQDLELALQQERKLRQEAEHDLQQEKQQKRAIEHDFSKKNYRKEPLSVTFNKKDSRDKLTDRNSYPQWRTILSCWGRI